MALYILDTDICIFWLKGNRRIEQRVLKIGLDQITIAVVTACELVYGAWKSAQPEENLRAVSHLQRTVRTLHTTDEVSQHFGRWKSQMERSGLGLDDADLLIAAITQANHGTLVTNNESHFRRLPELSIENWLK